jgi:hypothetical protein
LYSIADIVTNSIHCEPARLHVMINTEMLSLDDLIQWWSIIVVVVMLESKVFTVYFLVAALVHQWQTIVLARFTMCLHSL